MTQVDNRQHNRRSAGIEAKVLYSGKEYSITLENISLGGAGIGKSRDWYPKMGVPFSVVLQLEEELVIDSEMIWSSDQLAGLKFELNDQQKDVLSKYLNTLQKEQKQPVTIMF